MADKSNTDVVIEGETFNLVSIPKVKSKMVQNTKDSLLGTLDLASLVDDLGKLGNFIRVAYNGVAGYTEVQIKVQRVGYKITKLADKSAVTVHSFKGASTNVLQTLQGTYQYLLDGLEEMAIETLSGLADVAAEMANAAKELHDNFEAATTDVIDALEDTQREKGSEEARSEQLEKERREFEMRKKKAVELQMSALKSEARAQALYDQAQAQEDKAMNQQFMLQLVEAFTRPLGALANIAGAATPIGKAGLLIGAAKNLVQAETQVDGRSEGSAGQEEARSDKESEKMMGNLDDAAKEGKTSQANQEKLRHLDDLQKQRDIRREAIQQCIEFTERIKSCRDDSTLAEAAIGALHNSIGALKSLSAIMMNAAMFWQQMQIHCESLAKRDIQQCIEKAMKLSEEKRLKVWTSTTFKTQAVRYYCKWVVLDDICGVYMLQIKKTRQDLFAYLEENPTIEQARNNVHTLAATFAMELKKAQEEIAKKDMKTSKEIKSLKASPE